MTIFLYNEKHDRIIDFESLDCLSSNEIGLLEKVIKLLENNLITNRYGRLVIAQEAKRTTNENGDSQIEFVGRYEIH